jgi:hypothetical protein
MELVLYCSKCEKVIRLHDCEVTHLRFDLLPHVIATALDLHTCNRLTISAT